MDHFARCFLLVFGQLAAGGFAALSVPPFHDLQRGFYKSTAGVYLGFAVLTVAGQAALLLRGAPLTADRVMEVVAWGLFVAVASTYLWTLWSERVVLRARAFLFTLAAGLLALVVSAQGHNLGGMLSVETVLYPLNFVLAALMLGAVTCGMMLGHWYLIDPGLSIEPLMRLLRLFVSALLLQLGIGLLTLAAFWAVGRDPTVARLGALVGEHHVLLLARVLAGPVAALGLAAMIWRTLLVPQTMAATGLFYIATLSALVGELLGRFILFRTSLPL